MKPKNKTPELASAKEALQNYLKSHNLDPTVDWTKDKVHGKEVTKLVMKLNKERDKVAAKFPETDPKTMKKIKTMAKNTTVMVEAKVKAAKAEKELVKKETSSKKPAKYDYPLVDGREMTAEEKKKYRAEQRRLAAGSAEKKPKAPKKEKTSEAPKKDEAPVIKKSKKDKPTVAEEKKPVKKIKKSKKDED